MQGSSEGGRSWKTQDLVPPLQRRADAGRRRWHRDLFGECPLQPDNVELFISKNVDIICSSEIKVGTTF